MDESIQKASPDDLLIWPDGTCCYRSELWDMGHKSDDFRVVSVYSAGYAEACAEYAGA